MTAVTPEFRKILLEFAPVRRVLISFLFVSVGICSGDTIRLKNGRTIVAENVREKDGRIEYEIGDDLYRIPKSVVERIETSTPNLPDPEFGPGTMSARPNPDATLPVPSDEALKVPGFKDALNNVIRNGRVDLDALNSLETTGNSDLVAAGYFVAGRFEFERGDRDTARRYLERALSNVPDNPVILSFYASLLVQMGRAREAINYAHRATIAAPDSADAFNILGYAYFSSDRTRDAIPAWERSLELRPDKRIQTYLAKARRELSAEANFSEHDTGRFTLRFEGSATKTTLRQQIVGALEKDYDELSSQLGITPYQNIPVILYTEQAFFDVTQAPSWTGALNDGKLRIPVQGVDFINPEMARVLKHELAHSFINQASAGRCPQWLNEGIAQLVENRTFRGAQLARIYKSESQVPLKSLERSFMGFTTSQATLAYEQSLAATVFIRDTYGIDDIRRLLEHLAQGGSMEDALRDVLNTDYSRFEQDLTQFLATRYGS
ncbi:MAG TPA: tetratricopeptide repeat protein [Terriglobales bacterium]|nr:tetratricopeptide repeat protein [Terriglobales bacterium]